MRISTGGTMTGDYTGVVLPGATPGAPFVVTLAYEVIAGKDVSLSQAAHLLASGQLVPEKPAYLASLSLPPRRLQKVHASHHYFAGRRHVTTLEGLGEEETLFSATQYQAPCSGAQILLTLRGMYLERIELREASLDEFPAPGREALAEKP